MSDKLSEETSRAVTEKRILNEFEGRIVNEEHMDKVVESKKGKRDTSHSAMQFNCECDDAECLEAISISTEEYKRVHRKANYFIVVPRHVHLDLERVVASFNNYVLVEKRLAHPAAA